MLACPGGNSHRIAFLSCLIVSFCEHYDDFAEKGSGTV
jgi:hypothetical protein